MLSLKSRKMMFNWLVARIAPEKSIRHVLFSSVNINAIIKVVDFIKQLVEKPDNGIVFKGCKIFIRFTLYGIIDFVKPMKHNWIGIGCFHVKIFSQNIIVSTSKGNSQYLSDIAKRPFECVSISFEGTYVAEYVVPCDSSIMYSLKSPDIAFGL